MLFLIQEMILQDAGISLISRRFFKSPREEARFGHSVVPPVGPYLVIKQREGTPSHSGNL